jgi:hypothetical protein
MFMWSPEFYTSVLQSRKKTPLWNAPHKKYSALGLKLIVASVAASLHKPCKDYTTQRLITSLAREDTGLFFVRARRFRDGPSFCKCVENLSRLATKGIWLFGMAPVR